MYKRELLLGASSSLILSACTSSTGSNTLSGNIDRQQAVLQASIVVGAALGYAVARDRGGSALVGIAIGAAAGAIAASALQYARYVARRASNDIEKSFALTRSAISEDTATFQRENVPIVQRRAQLSRQLAQPGRISNPLEVVDHLENLKAQERATTIPIEAYVQAAPVYRQCLILLPEVTLSEPLLPPERDAEGKAQLSSDNFTGLVDSNARTEISTRRRLQEFGIIL